MLIKEYLEKLRSDGFTTVSWSDSDDGKAKVNDLDKMLATESGWLNTNVKSYWDDDGLHALRRSVLEYQYTENGNKYTHSVIITGPIREKK